MICLEDLTECVVSVIVRKSPLSETVTTASQVRKYIFSKNVSSYFPHFKAVPSQEKTMPTTV